MIFRNDHGAECTCFDCVMRRMEPFAYRQRKPGRGRDRVVVSDIERAIRMHGSQAAAARSLGVSRMTVVRRIKERKGV